jgi:poly(A) polymerase
VEPTTAELIRKHASQVGSVSPERQRDELMRILATPRAGAGLRLLDELELLGSLLPEVTETRGVEQPKEHHWDVFGHSLETVRNLDYLMADARPDEPPWGERWSSLWGGLSHAEAVREHFRREVVAGRPRLAVLKLGGLLHDVAKPETKTFEESGRMRFFGHPQVGADKAKRILRRLHFSTREIGIVAAMVRAHLRPVQMAQQGPPTRRAIYRLFRDCGDAAIDTLFLSLADHLGTVGPRADEEEWRKHVALVNYILTKRYEEIETVEPAKLVTGDDIMSELGLSPGPLVGRLVEAVREARAAGDVSTRDEALELARALAAEGEGS